MDFVGGGSSGTGGLGSDNGPILYSEPNRTSAIDDLRSVVIYIFIITIILGFLLILPGVRSEKLPTFLCITTSIIVTSIILVVLFGTTWHVGQVPISGPYKAFSKDRIQGELSVKIGLISVNITLQAHKYYELHVTHPVPVILEDQPASHPHPILGTPTQVTSSSQTIQTITTTTTTTTSTTTRRPVASSGSSRASSFIETRTRQPVNTPRRPLDSASSLADELLSEGRNSDDSSADAELEVEEVFSGDTDDPSASLRRARSPNSDTSVASSTERSSSSSEAAVANEDGFTEAEAGSSGSRSLNSSKQKRNVQSAAMQTNGNGDAQKYTIVRSNVDINYNERFYWIEPDQMRQEYHKALERGLPYPILTVVEYLSQDEAGFSWSRQYRSAGYYSKIILWLSFCVCMLMFFLHCAAPKYGIYTMQAIGCLLLFTNFTYSTLVPKGDRKLVIPFEGQSLTLDFGWNYWLVLIGGCLSLMVGTLFVIIDSLFPNFIFTTILDVDFDSHTTYYKHKRRLANGAADPRSHVGINGHLDRPVKPPFLEHSTSKIRSKPLSVSSSISSGGSNTRSMDTAEVVSVSSSIGGSHLSSEATDKPISRRRSSAVKLINTATSSSSTSSSNEVAVSIGPKASHLSELFVGPLIRRSVANTFSSSTAPTTAANQTRQLTLSSDSEMKRAQEGQLKRDSNYVDMLETSDTYLQHENHGIEQQQPPVRGGSRHKSQNHYGANGGGDSITTTNTANIQTPKNTNLKITDHQSRRQASSEAANHRQVRL